MIQLNVNDNKIKLKGNITFDNIVSIIDLYNEKTKELVSMVIDLEEVSYSNSCTLIFMINCMRKARKEKKEIKFINVPILLKELSKVYNLNQIINNG